MREKFERSRLHSNIDEIRINQNETLEKKIARIKRTKEKIANISIDSSLKDGLNAVLDKSLEYLEQQNTLQEAKNIHHR